MWSCLVALSELGQALCGEFQVGNLARLCDRKAETGRIGSFVQLCATDRARLSCWTSNGSTVSQDCMNRTMSLKEIRQGNGSIIPCWLTQTTKIINLLKRLTWGKKNALKSSSSWILVQFFLDHIRFASWFWLRPVVLEVLVPFFWYIPVCSTDCSHWRRWTRLSSKKKERNCAFFF